MFYWQLRPFSPCCLALYTCATTGIFFGKEPEKAFTRNKKGVYCIKRKKRLCVGEVSLNKTGRQRRGAMNVCGWKRPGFRFKGEMHRRWGITQAGRGNRRKLRRSIRARVAPLCAFRVISSEWNRGNTASVCRFTACGGFLFFAALFSAFAARTREKGRERLLCLMN